MRQENTHEYELYMALEDIDHSKTKVKPLQTYGICDQLHRTMDAVQLENDGIK